MFPIHELKILSVQFLSKSQKHSHGKVEMNPSICLCHFNKNNKNCRITAALTKKQQNYQQNHNIVAIMNMFLTLLLIHRKTGKAINLNSK
jgi:uncharacterized pyridoxamine 5'-phosphate oxidase family protein